MDLGPGAWGNLLKGAKSTGTEELENKLTEFTLAHNETCPNAYTIDNRAYYLCIHTEFSTQLAKCLLHFGTFGVYCHYCGWSGNETTLMLLQTIVYEHYYNTVCGCLYVNTSTVQTTAVLIFIGSLLRI